jgi:hypothetical protein
MYTMKVQFFERGDLVFGRGDLFFGRGDFEAAFFLATALSLPLSG